MTIQCVRGGGCSGGSMVGFALGSVLAAGITIKTQGTPVL